MIKLCIPEIDNKEITAVTEAIQSGWLTHGPFNKEFEDAFAQYVGVKHAIACNSCTSALFLTLKALDVTGEIILPSFSFVATANAVVTASATPRFVDIKYHSCNIDPKEIQKAITKQTQAIMIVHYAGQCCQMDDIMALVDKHNLILIEDSAETIGGTYKGRQAGSFGIGCFSFFPTKNITTGEGGMITTNDTKLAQKIRTMIGHGIDSMSFEREKMEMPWFRSAVMPGYNFRMSNILAAIGVEQMKKLNRMNSARREHSQYLINALKDIQELELPHECEGCEHTYQMFTIKLNKDMNRDAFVKRLNKKGIGASVHFYPPIHEQSYYKEHPQWQNNSLRLTEDVSRRIVSLPMYPRLTKKELDQIIAALKAVIVE